MELKVFNSEGKQVETIKVDETIFGAAYNQALIHQVIVAQLANKRQGTKSALTRAEVRGGGAKPYRQKGTGRARHGSIRSPQWRKGGVVFAPKPRDFSKKINKKMKRAAMISALSQKVRQNDFIVLDELKLEQPKTKLMATILKNLEVSNRTLIITKNDNDILMRASRNIKGIMVTQADCLNVYDLVSNQKCVVTKDAVKVLEEVNK